MNRLVVAIGLLASILPSTASAQIEQASKKLRCDSPVAAYFAAAKTGDAFAMACVGLKYANGIGVPRSDAEATIWFRKAADSGQPYGMFMTGVAFWSGRGVAQDFVEAYKWLDLSTKFTTEKNQPAMTALEGITRVLSPQQITEAKKRGDEWERDFQKRKRD